MATHETTLGESTVTVGRFKGFKATEMLTLLGAIYEEIPELEQRMDAFVRKYKADNRIPVPRAFYEAEYPVEAARVSAEAWEASGNVMEMPGEDPSLWRVLLGQMPDIIKLARKRAFDLLALAICPNDELRELDIEDEVDRLYGKDGVLAPYRMKLLHEAEGQQLLELAGVVIDVIKDQFGGEGDGLGKLMPLAELLGALLGVERDQAEPAPQKTAARSSSSRSGKRSKAGAAKRSSTRSRGGKSAASVGS